VVGCKFSFIVTVSVSSSNLKIITDAGTTLLQGAVVGATTTATLFNSAIATSNISVLMNGTTTGGLQGSWYEFTCISATAWQVQGMNFGSSTVATPFSTS